MIESKERAIALLERMMLIRRFEEKCAEAYSLGKIRGFLHLCDGEEAVAVGAMSALTPEDDIVATYREHGHALARGLTPESLLAEMYGKSSGCSRGRGGSMHLFCAEQRFWGGHAIVGGGLPVAVGLALARSLQRREGITACFFGDGALAEGELHESLNLAALWQLPVLFVCENNLYAMGTAIDRHQAVTNVCDKPRAHGIDAKSVDGMDLWAMEDAATRAASAVRTRREPFFLEAKTYRFRAHSMFDAELYRSKDEVTMWRRERDPIMLFRESLLQKGDLNQDILQILERRVESIVAEAERLADDGALEPVEDLEKDVYAEHEP